MVATEWVFDFCAGHVALDFANTVSERESGKDPVERLPDWRQLVRFARQADLVSATEAAARLRWGAAHPADAERIRRDAVGLREALYRVFAATARRREPDLQDLGVINAWIHRLRLDARLEWSWSDGADAPDAFLAGVVRAAMELLIDAVRRERLRICDADDCAWVFLDTSKNRSRRWCDMKQCGNRDKVRRFYARHR